MRRGFTLVETMVTMLLVLMLLGVLGSLLRAYSQVANFSDQHDQALRLATALSSLQTEAAQALTVQTPAAGSSATELLFRRLDPARSGLPVGPGDRLPLPVPDPDPYVAWDPSDPADQIAVRYRVDGNQLVREVDGNRAVLSAEATGLACDHLANGNLVVRISALINGRVVTSGTEVFRCVR